MKYYLLFVIFVGVTTSLFSQTTCITYELRRPYSGFVHKHYVYTEGNTVYGALDPRDFEKRKAKKNFRLYPPTSTVHVAINNATGEHIVQYESKNLKKSYKHTNPEIEWTILDEYDEIAGYKVQKAIAVYDYVHPYFPEQYKPAGYVQAWFSRELPVSIYPLSTEGNHDMLGGDLPGAILRLGYAEDLRTYFEAVEVAVDCTPKRPVSLRLDHECTTTRKEYFLPKQDGGEW